MRFGQSLYGNTNKIFYKDQSHGGAIKDRWERFLVEFLSRPPGRTGMCAKFDAEVVPEISCSHNGLMVALYEANVKNLGRRFFLGLPGVCVCSFTQIGPTCLRLASTDRGVKT